MAYVKTYFFGSYTNPQQNEVQHFIRVYSLIRVITFFTSKK